MVIVDPWADDIVFEDCRADLLAGRLSEDPSISVAVLEAGECNLDDPNILIPGQFGRCLEIQRFALPSSNMITCRRDR